MGRSIPLLLLLCAIQIAAHIPEPIDYCKIDSCTPSPECEQTGTRPANTSFTIKCASFDFMRVDNDYFPTSLYPSWECDSKLPGGFWTSGNITRPIAEVECLRQMPCTIATPLKSSCRSSISCDEINFHDLEGTKLHCPTKKHRLEISEDKDITNNFMTIVKCGSNGTWTGTSGITGKDAIIPPFANVRCVRDRTDEDRNVKNSEKVVQNPWDKAKAKREDKAMYCQFGFFALTIIGVLTAVPGIYSCIRWRRRINVKTADVHPQNELAPIAQEPSGGAAAQEVKKEDETAATGAVHKSEDGPRTMEQTAMPVSETFLEGKKDDEDFGRMDDEDYDTMTALDKYYTRADRHRFNIEDFSDDDLDEMSKTVVQSNYGKKTVKKNAHTDRAKAASKISKQS
ncbi:hypothetical protein PFISCL1PPCAC_3575, partial [Pristionchus fissidentatus]